MKNRFFTTFIFTLFFFPFTRAQTDTSRINIGLSIPQLVGGTPELMMDYFFSRSFGLSLNTGYNYKTVPGFIKVGSFSKINEQHGTYFKLGFKARIYTKRPFATPFVQAFYVASFYNEKGTVRDHEDPMLIKDVSSSGFTNGIAIASGVDLKIFRGLAVKIAIQWGHYKRTDHLAYPSNTYQPGLGQEWFALNNQLLFGLVYKFK